MNDKSKHAGDSEKKQKEKQKQEREEHKIDVIDEDSFPASDPPPWTTGRTGDPKRNGNDKEK